MPEQRIVLPPIYGYPIDFYKNGQSMTRKDYKAGVIDRESNEREFAFEQKKYKVAIDVYFLNHHEQRTCEDNYAFDLFIRSKHPDALSKEEELAFAEEDYQANVGLFNKLIPWIMNALERKADGRLRSISIFSRNSIKDILKRTMQGINHSIENNEN